MRRVRVEWRPVPPRVAATAIGAVFCLLSADQAAAQIGLSPSKKGESYFSIESGYQSRSNTDSALLQGQGAPSSTGARVQENAYATPNGVGTSVRITEPGVSVSTESWASPIRADSKTDIEHVSGPESAFANSFGHGQQGSGSDSGVSGATPGASAAAAGAGSGDLVAAAASSAAATSIGPVATAAASAASATSVTYSSAASAASSSGAIGYVSASYNGVSPAVTTSHVAAAGVAGGLDAANGGLGALTYGYVFQKRAWGLFDRFEAYGSFTSNENTQGIGGTSFTATTANGLGMVAAYDSAGLEGRSTVSVATQEFGLRFKSDNGVNGPLPLIFSFEPFLRHITHNASSDIAGVYSLSSKYTANMVGAQVALETEVRTGIAALSWVGRVSGGLYGIAVDAKMAESIGPYAVGTDDDAFKLGYRLGLESGFRLRLNENASMTLTGAVEHLSQSASFSYASGGVGTDRALDLGSSTDYQAKLGLVFRMN